jgi:hypothetical protein
LRHDLAPVETSQVPAVGLGEKAVGNDQILMTVVVEIKKSGPPGPSPHRHSGVDTGIAEGAVPIVEEKGIPQGVPLKSGAITGVESAL